MAQSYPGTCPESRGSAEPDRVGALLQVWRPVGSGKTTGGIGVVIPPLLFLVIFYLLIAMLGNQMLSSTLEEKENRVTEMILTTLNPTTLIIGRITALVVSSGTLWYFAALRDRLGRGVLVRI
jgi:ABC-type Na+ efflux pump permease subunit